MNEKKKKILDRVVANRETKSRGNDGSDASQWEAHHPTIRTHDREEQEVKRWVKDLKDKIGFSQLSITKRKSDSSPGLGLHIMFPGAKKAIKHKTKAKPREWKRAFFELLDLLEARGIELPDEYRREDEEDRPQVETQEWSIKKAVDEFLGDYRRRIRIGEYKKRSYSDPESRGVAIKSFEDAWKPLELLGMKQGRKWYRRYVAFRRGKGAGDSTITKELRFLDRVKRFAKTEGKYEGETGPDQWKRVLTPVTGSRNRSLTWAEYEQLLAELDLKWQLVLTFSVHTGAEKSVCERILAKDVKLEEGRVWLPGTKQRATSQKAGKKNFRARWVHLSDDQIPVMEQILVARKLVLEQEKADPARADHLFPWFSNSFCKALRTACKKLGVEQFTHHDCRHVFATFRLLAGHRYEQVSNELGESPESEMLKQVYSEATSEHIFPPLDQSPLPHGWEWKVLRKPKEGGGNGANGGLGQNWDKKSGPVRVGEPPQVLDS